MVLLVDAAAACALGVELFESESAVNRCETISLRVPAISGSNGCADAALLLRRRPNQLATLGGLLPRLPEPQDSSRTHKRTTEAAATLRLRVVAVAPVAPAVAKPRINQTNLPQARTRRVERVPPDGRRDARVDDDLLLRPLFPLLHREEHVGRLHGEREVVGSQPSRRRRNADLPPVDGRPRPGDI